MAGFTLNLTPQVAAQRAELKNFQKRQLPRMVSQALRDTTRALKTEAGRYMAAKVIGMPKGKIARHIRPEMPKPSGFKAALIIKRKKTSSIASFGGKAQTKLVSGQRRLAGKGIRARVWAGKGEPRKLYKGSFIWNRPGTEGVASTALHRVSGKAKVVPSKRTGGDGERRRYKRNFTDKQGVKHRKGSLIKRQPIATTFATSVASVFDQIPKSGSRKPVREHLMIEGRKIFKKKLEARIRNLK